MPQLTGVANLVGTYPAGGTAPVISYDTLPYGTPTVWNVVAVNVSVTDLTERIPSRNGNGVVNGFIFGEAIKQVELSAKVQAPASGGIAACVAAALVPSAGTSITLAGFIAASGNTVIDGIYILDEGCKLELSDSETEPAKITFTAKQYSTAASSLLATVS